MVLISTILSCNFLLDEQNSSSVSLVCNNSTNCQKWKEDFNGCSNLRNAKLAKDIIAECGLKDSFFLNFIYCFGIPNDIIIDEDSIVLVYYFGIICEPKVNFDLLEKCYAMFTFKNNILIDSQFICE